MPLLPWPWRSGDLRPSFRAARALFKDPEVAQQPPQKDEDQDRAEAAAAQFLGSVTGRQSPQEFAHAGRRGKCRAREVIFPPFDTPTSNTTMGKGDKRTKKGKIYRGSYGTRRPRKLKNKIKMTPPTNQKRT
jgi:30S ribosomal protein S31